MVFFVLLLVFIGGLMFISFISEANRSEALKEKIYNLERERQEKIDEYKTQLTRAESEMKLVFSIIGLSFDTPDFSDFDKHFFTMICNRKIRTSSKVAVNMLDSMSMAMIFQNNLSYQNRRSGKEFDNFKDKFDKLSKFLYFRVDRISSCSVQLYGLLENMIVEFNYLQNNVPTMDGKR